MTPPRDGRASSSAPDELLTTLAAARELLPRVAQSGRTPYVQELHGLIARLEKCEALLRAERGAHREVMAQVNARKEGAFEERDHVIVLAAKLAAALGYPVGQLPHVGGDWGPQWKRVVAIELPTGQVAWHLPEMRASLFDWLPPHPRPWDGHDTKVKYQRVDAVPAPPAADASDAPGTAPRLALVHRSEPR